MKEAALESIARWKLWSREGAQQNNDYGTMADMDNDATSEPDADMDEMMMCPICGFHGPVQSFESPDITTDNDPNVPLEKNPSDSIGSQ